MLFSSAGVSRANANWASVKSVKVKSNFENQETSISESSAAQNPTFYLQPVSFSFSLINLLALASSGAH